MCDNDVESLDHLLRNFSVGREFWNSSSLGFKVTTPLSSNIQQFVEDWWKRSWGDPLYQIILEPDSLAWLMSGSHINLSLVSIYLFMWSYLVSPGILFLTLLMNTNTPKLKDLYIF